MVNNRTMAETKLINNKHWCIKTHRILTEVHPVLMVPLQEAKQQVSEMTGSFSGNAVEKDGKRWTFTQGLAEYVVQD